MTNKLDFLQHPVTPGFCGVQQIFDFALRADCPEDSPESEADQSEAAPVDLTPEPPFSIAADHFAALGTLPQPAPGQKKAVGKTAGKRPRTV